MASTYSTNLKIELMGTGDQVGSWGSTTNNNFQYALEEAIVGYVNVQFTNDANLTISLSDSNASQTARNYFLYVTSTVTLSAQRDLIVPTIEKPYVVHNATTGSQAIRVKTAAGTGIVVPSGKKMILYVDGTNVVEQADYATSFEIGSLSITTPLPVASGGTGSSTASGARTNLGLGTIATQAANNVAITGGSITGITDLAVADGGTGASTASGALNNLLPTQTSNNGKYLKTDGTNASWDALDISTADITGTLPIANGGTNATTASGARTSLGLGTVSTQDANNVNITGGSITGITDLAIADGGTGASTAANARTNLGLGTMATVNSPAPVANGGTGATDAGTARTNLGLGTISTLNSINNSNWSGTALAVANGGTGATDAGTARTNLGLGTIATQAASNVAITGGSITGITDLAVADGGTGTSSLTANAVLLGNGTSAIQTVAPSTNGNTLRSNGTTWTSAAPLTFGTAVVPVSVTFVDFTGIPSWAKQITLIIEGVSTTGSDDYLAQIITGTSTVVNSGYVSRVSTSGGNSGATTGFRLTRSNPGASTTVQGIVNFINISGNIWVQQGTVATDSSECASGAGTITLGAALTGIRFTTLGGINDIDSGTVNIMYE